MNEKTISKFIYLFVLGWCCYYHMPDVFIAAVALRIVFKIIDESE